MQSSADPLLLLLRTFPRPAGFPQFQQGFVPSPQNPMPRLRRRKSAPERVQPSVSSPIRTLFTRRSSLAGPLLPGFGYAAGEDAAAAAGAVGAGAGAAGAPQSAAEAQLRHCLQQPRTQRWAAAEFCYSSLDRPFFMFNPLSSLLTAMGLGQDARLTRREWAVIRSGLGACQGYMPGHLVAGAASGATARAVLHADRAPGQRWWSTGLNRLQARRRGGAELRGGGAPPAVGWRRAAEVPRVGQGSLDLWCPRAPCRQAPPAVPALPAGGAGAPGALARGLPRAVPVGRGCSRPKGVLAALRGLPPHRHSASPVHCSPGCRMCVLPCLLPSCLLA